MVNTMNYKLSPVLLLPLLMIACTKQPQTESKAPVETQVTQQHATKKQPTTMIFLEVSPETKPCEGVAPQTCLLVRELTINSTGEKTYLEKQPSYFYDSIDGFTHNPKLAQIIKVKRTEILHPAADQSQYQYTFDSIVETTAQP